MSTRLTIPEGHVGLVLPGDSAGFVTELAVTIARANVGQTIGLKIGDSDRLAAIDVVAAALKAGLLHTSRARNEGQS